MHFWLVKFKWCWRSKKLQSLKKLRNAQEFIKIFEYLDPYVSVATEWPRRQVICIVAQLIRAFFVPEGRGKECIGGHDSNWITMIYCTLNERTSTPLIWTRYKKQFIYNSVQLFKSRKTRFHKEMHYWPIFRCTLIQQTLRLCHAMRMQEVAL